MSHALGDAQDEAERVDAALRADPKHPGALAMARRAALALHDLPLVEELLARERSGAGARERDGLFELSAAIADGRSQAEEARRFDAETDLEGDEAAGARLAAVAFGEDRAATLASARSAFSGLRRTHASRPPSSWRWRASRVTAPIDIAQRSRSKGGALTLRSVCGGSRW